ncbi:MAG: hypothetical protein ACLPX9_04630 [Rhodomicrobium sp.]
MFRHTCKRTPLAVLSLAALLGSEATAAPEGAPQDAPPPPAQVQAQADDHSYLPPWMRPQAGTGPATPQSQYLNALDDPALKQKPPQRRRRRSTFDEFFW